MRRKSFLALFAPPVLIALSAISIFAQTTYTVLPDSKTSAPPTPDTATPSSTDLNSPASDAAPPTSTAPSAPASDGTAPDSATPTASTPIPPDADPNAPGLTPEEKSAATEAHRAHVKALIDAAQVRVAAAREKFAAADAAQAQAAAAAGVPHAAVPTAPAPDSTTPAASAPAPIPPDGDPNAPGLTPEQKSAASAAHRAHVLAVVATTKALVAANKARATAYREKLAAESDERELEKDPDSPQNLEKLQKDEEKAAAKKATAESAAAFRAKLAAEKAIVDANLARIAANKKQIENLHADDPTTFTPDHENLNKFSYQAMFKMDAFAALNEALAIQARTTRPTLTPSESALFQAIHSGQGGKYSFAEAALIASGVDDYNKRKAYMAKIDQIVAKNKEQTDKEKWLVNKADDIIGYLLAVTMKNGYDDDTANLAQVLDTGHYNCISSCVMFVVVAHGVGLDVGAVVEPEHIVARVPGYDVQTTSGRIFATDFRLKDIQDQKYSSDVMNKFDPDHPYHEVGDYGILLELYQTIANNARDKKQADQAAIGALKEVFLDPTMPCAGHDLKVFLNDWFNAATTRKDATTAAAIAKLYREMSRDPQAADEMDQCVVNLKKQLAKH